MPLTPETLPRHELIGLQVEVVDAADKSYIGIQGEVVNETKQTLSIEGASQVRQVPKQSVTFKFTLPDESVEFREDSRTTSELNGEDVAYVTVDGERLLSRPAQRTETQGDTLWESD